MDNNTSNRVLEYIQDFLIQLAEGNFQAKLNVAEENDEQLVGVQVGINMLVEELQSTTISRQFLNSIYNGINDILIVLNDKGEIQQINTVGTESLGYKEQELINYSIEKIINIDSIDTIRKAIKKTIKSKKSEEIGLNFYTKGQGIINTSCSFSYLYDSQYNSRSILMLAKDIAILLDAKKQLENKSDELNLFVYKASHDLKSPVASMLGLLNLAQKTNKEAELKEYIKLFSNSTKKLETILNELLIIGQVTYGKLDIKPLKIYEVFQHLIEEFQFNDTFKKIDFVLSIDESLEYVYTEFNLFKTIMFNLIDNAIKYSKTNISNPYIHIAIEPSQKGIIVNIKDNGIGIDPLLQKDVFKMFYRATYESKGSGLGLYIVNISVQKLEGTITLESTLGEGSTFKVYIPSLSQ